MLPLMYIFEKENNILDLRMTKCGLVASDSVLI